MNISGSMYVRVHAWLPTTNGCLKDDAWMIQYNEWKSAWISTYMHRLLTIEFPMHLFGQKTSFEVSIHTLAESRQFWLLNLIVRFPPILFRTSLVLTYLARLWRQPDFLNLSPSWCGVHPPFYTFGSYLSIGNGSRSIFDFH